MYPVARPRADRRHGRAPSTAPPATLTAAGLPRFPGLEGPGALRHRHLRLPGHGRSPGAPVHPVARERRRPRPGRRLPAPERRPTPRPGWPSSTSTSTTTPPSCSGCCSAPGLINWVTAGHPPRPLPQLLRPGRRRHLHRRQRVELAIPVHPGGHRPARLHLPGRGQADRTRADSPPDVADERGRRGRRGQLGAADRHHARTWPSTAVGACTAPTASRRVERELHRLGHRPTGRTYTDPGQAVDPTYPNDRGLRQRPAGRQGRLQLDHPHLVATSSSAATSGSPRPSTRVTANAGRRHLRRRHLQLRDHRGHRLRRVRALPAARRRPWAPTDRSPSSWPDATNGTGTDGTPGPTLSQEEADHTGGTGFWGYNIYRENPGSTTFGLVGQVAENPTGATATYSFTDTGATAPGAAPGSSDTFPTATNPGIDCSARPGSWDPATSTSPGLPPSSRRSAWTRPSPPPTG